VTSDSLRDLLGNPRAATLAELIAQFRRSVITAVCPRPAWLTDAPNLPKLVRGALGRELHRTASPEAAAEQPCPWNPPCTLDVLFGWQRMAGIEKAIRKPYAVTVDVGEAVAVRLVLFGAVEPWTHAAADALVAALRGGIAENGKKRLEAERRCIEDHHGVEVHAPGREAVLEFRTPLAIDTRAETPPQESFFTALAGRIEALARWHGLVLPPLEADPLKDAFMALRYEFRPHQAARRHAAHRRATRSATFSGSILLTGDLAPVMPLLSLAEVTHVGGRVSWHGFGRCTLTVTA
jgi:hypothetical protein